MQKRTALIIIFLSLSFSIISGCGFRLKGFYDFKDKDYNNLTISVISGSKNYDSRIIDKLKQGIRSYNFKYSDSPNLSDYYIEIIDARYNKEIQTKSATGLVKQYLLTFYVKYAIYKKSSDRKFALVKPLDSFNLEKDYIYEPQNILGSDSEEDILASNLRKDATGKILDVLAQIIDNKKTSNKN